MGILYEGDVCQSKALNAISNIFLSDDIPTQMNTLKMSIPIQMPW